MKLIAKTAGLCLASMLVMGMALAGNAAAALLWLVCLEGVGLSKYINSKCLSSSGGLASEKGWQTLGVPAGREITVLLLAATITLKDTAAKTAVQCFNNGSRGEGIIEAEGKGKITIAEYANAKENCRGVEGCEAGGVEIVKGANLPWNIAAFVGTDGSPLTKISKGGVGAGAPGWEVKCKIAGIAMLDRCLQEEGAGKKIEEVELKSEVSGKEELLVRSRFQSTGEFKCSLTGKEKSGRVEGLFAILLPGGALSINKE